MAGDWIKMRGNLWDDPRVAKICDLTDAGEAAVVGGLYWLWATADQHSEDGIMLGLTLRAIDRKTGIAGFGDALVSAGWLLDSCDGVQIVRFEEHNGKSAKRRCSEAVRKMSARDADKAQQVCGTLEEGEQQSCAPREREEKENKEQDQKQKTRAPRFDAQAHLGSMGIDSQIASDWITHRKAKRAAITPTVIEGINREATKAGMPLADVLVACCQRGWIGFKAEWITEQQNKPVFQNSRDVRDSAFLAAIGMSNANPFHQEKLISGEVV